jgi:hypothetical protein
MSAALTKFLAADVAGDVGRLESAYPIVLVPLRIETRFDAVSKELHVRIYPDEFSADAHEPDLSDDERKAGQAYWAATGKDDLNAWQTLLGTYPLERAAWIVRVTDPGSPPPPASFSKASGWSRAVEARLLPDRFVVIGTRGSVTKQAVGVSVTEPLALTVGPDSLASDQIQLGPDVRFKLDAAVLWTIDWKAALDNGMGVVLPLDAEDLRLGFDRLIVIGVKTSMDPSATAARLAALFDAHHYSSGIAIVKQGTPTSNALGTPAGYPPADPNGERSFSVERGSALDATTGCAGERLTYALAIEHGHFAHVEGANLVEVEPALKMNRALFSATLGYFLDQIMSPLIGSDAVAEVGRYFSEWVIPRGPLSAFRIGRVPYGVLPATSLSRFQVTGNATPVEVRMAALLAKMRPVWLDAAGRAPHVGRTADSDADLLEVLSMDASARQARVRRVIGGGTWLNLFWLFQWPDAFWGSIHQMIGAALLGRIGVDLGLHPRILDMNFSSVSKLYDYQPPDGHMVDTMPLSEVAPLGPRDYISWLQTATLDQLQGEALPATMPNETRRILLYRLLRHSALTEYHWWTNVLLRQYPLRGPADEWREFEMVGIVPGTEQRQTPWQRFRNQVNLPGLGAVEVAQLMDTDSAELYRLTGVGDFRDALAVLAPLPTAELDRLFGESLDAVSHRLDAWITSLATQRLGQMQSSRDSQPGCYVGAYGFVENLRPENSATVKIGNGVTARTARGGYVQAPTTTHATTAAVLRNAFLTHLGQANSPYAIDLSSAQVRMGRFLLDSVRNGQPLGAVLGYLIERTLHEQHAESLIDPIRQLAPLVANKLEDSGQPADTVAARNVVDGLALRNKWKAGQLFGAGGLPPNVAHREVLERRLVQIDRDVAAVADLLLAESTHQIVRGSTAASGAGLDALAQGIRPPDPDVGRGQTGGITLTHRLAVILAATPPALGPGWPAPTPRADCELRLDSWVGALLGDPRNVTCHIEYPDAGDPKVTHSVAMTFDRLELRPLDVLSLARAVAVDPGASELDRRVLYAAFGETVPADAAANASFKIVYASDPLWDRATTRSVPELLELANVITHAVGAMRPLQPVDLVLPERAKASVADSRIDVTEAHGRVQAATATLQAVETTLGNAINAVPANAPPTPLQAAAIRSSMRDASLFGIAASFPSFVAGAQEGGVAPLSLLLQAKSVLVDLQARLDRAASAGDDVTKAQAIFGRDFQILTGFHFDPASATGQEIAQAISYGPTLVGGDAHAVDRWLMGASRVRDALGRWRMLRILAEASGAPSAPWSAVQLPHQPGEPWVALPLKPGESRASGKLSLLLHMTSGSLDLTQPSYGLFLDEWVETIPNAREHTGVAFRYEDTGGEAPQTILIAVPPSLDQKNWDFDSLVAIVSETLDNAKIRALDLEALDPLAQLIPGIFLAANTGDETISTMLATQLDIAITGQIT